MHIGIDIRTICGPPCGKGRYTHALVRELLRLKSRHRFTLYANRLCHDCADLFGAHIEVIHRGSFLWHLAVIGDFAEKHGDLFFAPTSFIIPAFMPKRIDTAVTVHDVIAFMKGGHHQTKATILERIFLRRALKKTSMVFVPSEATKENLIKLFPQAQEKICVTSLAADEKFSEPAKDAELVKKKYNLPARFILAVAGLEPRKNAGGLIDAVAALHGKNDDIALVIAGGKGWKSEQALKKIAINSSFVHHLSACSDDELRALYQTAEFLVFPSLSEGFGIPILEAMAAGCPVACSNSSSMPEVAGDAALFFNPSDQKEMQNVTLKLWSDSRLRNELSQKGRARAQQFSWKKTAEKTLTALETLE